MIVLNGKMIAPLTPFFVDVCTDTTVNRRVTCKVFVWQRAWSTWLESQVRLFPVVHVEESEDADKAFMYVRTIRTHHTANMQECR